MQKFINLIKESEVGTHQRSFAVKQLEMFIKDELDYYYKYPIESAKNIINKLRKATDNRSVVFWSHELHKVLKNNKQRIDKLENK